MPCTVAKHAGFCMGVRQAVEKAERAAAQARERGIRYVRKPQTSQGEQLCWSCYHATNPENVCPWCGRKPNGDIRWDPVPGWEAEEMIVNGEKTLWVKKCPLFREG